jgi:hypothetical protein
MPANPRAAASDDSLSSCLRNRDRSTYVGSSPGAGWPSVLRYSVHTDRGGHLDRAAGQSCRQCGVAVGWKNCFFAGSDADGRRAAAMYPLSETTKLNDLNPAAYLVDVPAGITDQPSALPNCCSGTANLRIKFWPPPEPTSSPKIRPLERSPSRTTCPSPIAAPLSPEAGRSVACCG